MSKQLSLSAAFSVLATAALALSYGGALTTRAVSPMQTGATAVAAAPALLFSR